MKNKKLQGNNTTKVVEMQVVFPLDLGLRIEAEDKVRTLIEVTERMDYNELTRSYQRQSRRGEATPKQMFQITILAFMIGWYSTRKIANACKTDIRFMYMLGGKRAPEHSKIARFIKEHLQGEAAENLFAQLVLLLSERGEIEFEHLFVDGTKIEANANRYSFVWSKSTNRYEARTDEKVSTLLERLSITYGIIKESGEEYLSALETLRKEKGISFAYGRGRRKTQLQRDMEALGALLERKEKYTKYQSTFKGRNSFSKTDPDATFMRMKDDHMGNGQLKAGYNLQLGVEGEYIVGAHICAERSDEPALFGLLERMDTTLNRKHKTIVADAGYESEENYKRLRERGQTAYVKP